MTTNKLPRVLNLLVRLKVLRGSISTINNYIRIYLLNNILLYLN